MGAMTPSFIIFILFIFASANTLKSARLHEKPKNEMVSKNTRVTSIKTIYGDIYDCINMHKQHSLDHPFLRDHKIKVRPGNKILATFSYNGHANKNNTHIPFNYENLWMTKKGCPKGTIPIRRETTNDLKIVDINNSRNHFSGSLPLNHEFEFAGIYNKPTKLFYGASANIGLQQPKVFSDQEYSSASIIIENSVTSELNQIKVGWMVNPSLYGDNRTRLYTSWTGINCMQCYNLKAPGFVMVSDKIPLDFALLPNILQDLPFFVFLQPNFGWWLGIGGTTFTSNDTQYIGYWPISLFTSMRENAHTIRFGGYVYTPVTVDRSPEMGSGVFVDGQDKLMCYMRRVKVIDETKYVIDVGSYFVEDVVGSICYKVGGYSFKGQTDGYSFFFGGSGHGKDKSVCST